MTTLPVADGARILGIHPKTLHHWLKQAKMSLTAHPTDARIKCVELEQIQQLARLHDRPLRPPAMACPGMSQQQPPPLFENETDPFQAAHGLLPPLPQEAGLIQRLSYLENQVTTLQESLTQLTLALLQERDRTIECRITALETIVAQLVGVPTSSPQPTLDASLCKKALPEAGTQALQLNPAEHHVRSRLPPLVEYAACGSYVIISSLEGELSFSPDSPEWFEWLATLSSFRFVGKRGRFTAYREAKNRAPTRSWVAYRLIHKRQRRSWLGITERLTIASLEQAAARLQTYVEAL